MRNYGEELGYWYLRFNGFFPILNYVIHRDMSHCDLGYHHDRDCDVLGVRFPYVFEDIGGQEDDWHQELMSNLSPRKTLGVICEVKTGRVENILQNHLLETCVKRFGFVQRDQAGTIVEDLAQRGRWCDENYEIFTLLISHINGRAGHKYVSMSSVVGFIKERIKKYERSKFSARMLFNSSLLQFLADERANSHF